MFAATTLEQTASTVMYTTLECAIDTDLQLLAISAVSTLTGYYHLLVPKLVHLTHFNHFLSYNQRDFAVLKWRT
jgi:hypothetical protein